MNAATTEFTLLRLRDVLHLCGKSRSTWYADIAAGLAPRPVSLGARSVCWPVSELRALNQARVAGKNNAAIRNLVEQLHADRALDVDRPATNHGGTADRGAA